MARREVTGNWTRDDRIAINENFRKLFEEYVGAGLDAAEAKEKAIQAVADSLYAKQTAETTRDELTRIIREQTAGGDVVPEVVQARGTHNTVGERLNSISQDLAQKANVAYVNNKVQEVNSSFKESYATLADLEAAYPSGDNHNHVVLADNMIYTYNGTWVSTQIEANGTGIVNGAVTAIKTDFLEPIGNLVLLSEVQYDAMLATPLEPVPTTGYDTSGYIPVKAGENFILDKVRYYKFINEAKTETLTEANTGNNNARVVVTAPANGYLRVSFSHANLNQVQVQRGTELSSDTEFGYKIDGLKFTNEQKNSLLSVLEKKTSLKIYKAGDSTKIRSSFDSMQDIVVGVKKRDTANQRFNFDGTWLVPKNSTDGQISPSVSVGEMFHPANDDIAPVRTFYTVGANHGYFCVEITGTDKTTADIGSSWSDGTYSWYIANVSGGTVTLLPLYQTVDGVSSPVTQTRPTTDLTHVSGAANTSTLPITNSSSKQLYPSTSRESLEYFVDGKKVTGDGIFNGENFKAVETYEILDYKALIDWIASASNRGKYFGDNRNSIAGIMKLSIVYDFGSGGSCVIYHSIRALNTVDVLNIQLLQSQALALSDHTLYQYMPNVKAKSGYDFKNLVDMTDYNSNLIFGTADYADPTIPPHRYVQWLQNGTTKKVGFTMGYISDKADGSNEERLINAPNAWDLRSTKKNYPLMLNPQRLEAGEYYSIVGYRKYISPETVHEATNISAIKTGNETYVYIDYHKDVPFANVPLTEHVGKEINIIESSEGFTSKNNIVDADGIPFSINNGYGYAILKIS